MSIPQIKLLEINFLHELCTCILKSKDVSYIEKKLIFLLQFYDVLNFDLGYEHLVWRGRKWEDEIGFSNVKELSFPPNDKTKAGRLNEPLNPMFYASFMQPTALTEIGAKDGDFIQIVGSKIAKKILGCIVGEYENIYRTGSASLIGTSSSNHIKSLFNKLEPKALNSFIYMDSFLSSILKDENAKDNEYLHSRILSKLLIGSVDNLKAIFYPSVALGNSMNMALDPRFVSESLVANVHCVLKINKRYDYGIYDYEIIKISKGEDRLGNLLW